MDIVTHLFLGAAVAQLPLRSKIPASSKIGQSWQKRALIGSTAAIFPDIDYVLFFWQPLEFLAYWHRAATHSLLLAPLWAWLLSLVWRRLIADNQSRSIFFWLCLAGVLSHTVIDSLTVFGTQWFAPFNNFPIAWDLLFVVDGYFTLSIFVSLLMLIWWRKGQYRFFCFSIPLSYLLMVLMFKQQAYQQLSLYRAADYNDKRAVVLLPQPFSPLYWQVIEPGAGGFNQAYLRLANDVIASQISQWSGLDSHQQSYQFSAQLNWNFYPTKPLNIDWRADAEQVWNHPEFKAFRDFAYYPVFYDYHQSIGKRCVWFSDLRYHWPNFIPSFRFGMCRTGDQPWRSYRMKYFSQSEYHPID